MTPGTPPWRLKVSKAVENCLCCADLHVSLLQDTTSVDYPIAITHSLLMDAEFFLVSTLCQGTIGFRECWSHF